MALEETSRQAKVMFQMTDDRLNGRSSPKSFSHFVGLLPALPSLTSAGNQDFNPINVLTPPISPVYDRLLNRPIHDRCGHLQDLRKCMPVVEVARMRDRSNDHSTLPGHRNRGLAAELVFLVLLALGDAVDAGFV